MSGLLGGRWNPHVPHMVDRVTILANAKAGMTGPGGLAVEDWQPIAADVPCLVTTDRESIDPQATGRAAPEDVVRYRVAFVNPPADLGRNHRMTWDAGLPLGSRVLSVVTPLTRDPTGQLWTCSVEDRGSYEEPEE